MAMLKKNQEEVKTNEIQGEVQEPKVTMLTDWKQLRVKNTETTVVNLTYPDGEIIGIEIKSLSKATLAALNDKYDSMKKAKPEPMFDKTSKRFVNAPEGSENYIRWQDDNKKIDNLKATETMICSLVNKPEGETLEEQAEFLQNVFKGGQFDEIFMEILKFSGYKIDDKIEQAKNS